jgi:hypothetical protein
MIVRSTSNASMATQCGLLFSVAMLEEILTRSVTLNGDNLPCRVGNSLTIESLLSSMQCAAVPVVCKLI